MTAAGRAWAVGATLAAPALRLLLRRRAARGKEDPARLPERFGTAGEPRPPGKLLWLHAASVGESVASLPLLTALPESLGVLLTTGTRTSATLMATRLAEMGLSHRVRHRYVPLDVPAWAARFLDAWRPDAACFLESELWPNLLAASRNRAIPLALVNARLSARSFAGWRRLPGLAREVLGSFDLVAARTAADAARLHALGAPDAVACGDLKAAAPALPADATELDRLCAALGSRPRWLAASTHAADERLVGDVHARLAARHPGLLTAVVPRHPERGAALAARLGAPLRSRGEGPPDAGGVWIADTLGELGLFYRAFPIALIGKGFGEGGGQNPWEPARLGCAVATGPSVRNFQEAVQALAEAGALRVVAGVDELACWVDAMLSDPDSCRQAGMAAQAAARRADDLAPRLAAGLARLAGVKPP